MLIRSKINVLLIESTEGIFSWAYFTLNAGSCCLVGEFEACSLAFFLGASVCFGAGLGLNVYLDLV